MTRTTSHGKSDAVRLGRVDASTEGNAMSWAKEFQKLSGAAALNLVRSGDRVLKTHILPRGEKVRLISPEAMREASRIFDKK